MDRSHMDDRLYPIPYLSDRAMDAILLDGDAAGSVFSEAPVISAVEAYVTPFDAWQGGDRPGEIEVSRLALGEVIGFHVVIYDYDPREEARTAWTPGMLDVFADPDRYIDGLLLGPDGIVETGEDSAVESVSWARIKAALQEE